MNEIEKLNLSLKFLKDVDTRNVDTEDKGMEICKDIIGRAKEIKSMLMDKKIVDRITVHSMTTCGVFKANTHAQFIEHRKNHQVVLRKSNADAGVHSDYIYLTKAEYDTMMHSVGDKVIFETDDYCEDVGTTKREKIISKEELRDEMSLFIEQETVISHTFHGLND